MQNAVNVGCESLKEFVILNKVIKPTKSGDIVISSMKSKKVSYFSITIERLMTVKKKKKRFRGVVLNNIYKILICICGINLMMRNKSINYTTIQYLCTRSDLKIMKL